MSKSSLYGKPKQIRQAGELIAKGLLDLEAGRSDGMYPALDALIEKRRHTHHGDIDPNSVCTPECQNRLKPELIRDVRPPTGERLAVLEHMAVDIQKEFDDHRRASNNFASKESVIEACARIDHEVLPALEKLANRSTLKTAALVISIIGLMVSMAYNLINLYKSFS